MRKAVIVVNMYCLLGERRGVGSRAECVCKGGRQTLESVGRTQKKHYGELKTEAKTGSWMKSVGVERVCIILIHCAR